MSMSNVLNKTLAICGDAFERTYSILKEKHTEGTFELQIMVYRNYNAPPEKLLQKTAFEATPQHLKQFLQTVKAEYGWGPEAIEIALK